jgi:hypothetical protein
MVRRLLVLGCLWAQFFMYPEASLTHIDAVNSRLLETQLELQNEIDSLQRELSANHDPERMQLIQEMISVRPDFVCPLQSIDQND